MVDMASHDFISKINTNRNSMQKYETATNRSLLAIELKHEVKKSQKKNQTKNKDKTIAHSAVIIHLYIKFYIFIYMYNQQRPTC